jgi:signal transduction histidine kinase
MKSGSLHGRLLIAFGALITVIVLLFSIGSLLALLRNPLVYGSATQQLRSAQQKLTQDSESAKALQNRAWTELADLIDEKFGVRSVFVQTDDVILADSQSSSALALRLTHARVLWLAQRNDVGLMRDDSGRVWLVLVQPADETTDLVLAVRRPRLAMIEFFTNEFLRPVTTATLVGMALAILLALALVNWIAAPIRAIDRAAQAAAEGHFATLQEEGPLEIRHLARSFNEMSARVTAAQQSQRDLMANVSHELKTPLTSIQGFSQAILDQVLTTPDEIQNAAGVIHSESGRMSRLVQDLLRLARLEADSQKDTLHPVDLAALLPAIEKRFRLQAETRQVQLVMEMNQSLPLVLGNEDRLAEIFSNLLDNALKFSPDGGCVQLTTAFLDGKVQISVSDEGPGIADSEKEQIFDRFYQVNYAGSTARNGSGLGLAIVRQIVRNHGGSITVSDHQPHGACFTVALPAVR